MASDRPRSGQYDSAHLRAVDEAERQAVHDEFEAFLKPPAKVKKDLPQLAKELMLEDFRLAVAALKQLNWSEAAIARSIGVVPQHLNELLKGTRNLQAWHLKALPPPARAVIREQLREGVPYEDCQDPPSWVGRTG